MFSSVFPVHENLAAAGRFPWLSSARRAATMELAILLLAGASAALALIFLNWKLRIPGHAILRSVLPMSVGLALVPRHLAGSVMGVGGLLTAFGLAAFGFAGLGIGAVTSLLLIGPFLDMALWRARQGWHIYLGFGLAGLMSNLVAWLVRAGPKVVGLERLGTRPVEEWWLPALFTYSLCGLIAGVLSAFVWFRLRTEPEQEKPA